MQRIVATETLDHLAENDPAAMRSRRDLQRVHRMLGTRSTLVRALCDMMRFRSVAKPLRILELGCGDGTLMLGVARALEPRWTKVEITLLDRQSLVTAETVNAYAALGWTAIQKTADVLDWASDANAVDSKPRRYDLIIANLFLHHFEGAQLNGLLQASTARCNRLFAFEPRRDWIALVGSHLIGAMGANAVTRADAVLSVRAGFRDNELTSLWPSQGASWRTREFSAGPFSHCFRAERVGTN